MALTRWVKNETIGVAGGRIGIRSRLEGVKTTKATKSTKGESGRRLVCGG